MITTTKNTHTPNTRKLYRDDEKNVQKEEEIKMCMVKIKKKKKIFNYRILHRHQLFFTIPSFFPHEYDESTFLNQQDVIIRKHSTWT
jgi:hypothetical protein